MYKCARLTPLLALLHMHVTGYDKSHVYCSYEYVEPVTPPPRHQPEQMIKIADAFMMLIY